MRKVILICTSLIIISWVKPASAYIDPGSGSAIISAVIGFFVASGLVIKTYWYKLTSVFKRNRPAAETEPDGET